MFAPDGRMANLGLLQSLHVARPEASQLKIP
jgi:hypothetical protein